MTDQYSTPAPMPSYSGPFQPGMNTPPPVPPKKQAWFKKPLVFLPAAALLLGLGIGSASAKTETVEVTKEVQVPGPERTVTKEVKVNVPTTPAACLEALTINETAFTYLSESLGHVLDGDYAAANTSTERVKALVPKSNAAKAACRAS